ncbi:MAG: SH3 domain-containing protein [candidate division WOR-3 bacterium]
MRHLLLVGVIVLFYTVGACGGAPRAVYQARIIADNVNVRARPSLTGEVIGQLNKGEIVRVNGEILTVKRDDNSLPELLWVRIELPSKFEVWVAKRYVDSQSGSVIANKLNVRSGPSIFHSVICVLEKGVKVKIIREHGEWLAIEPPVGSCGYVSAEYVEPVEEKGPIWPEPAKIPIVVPESKPSLDAPDKVKKEEISSSRLTEEALPSESIFLPQTTENEPSTQPEAVDKGQELSITQLAYEGLSSNSNRSPTPILSTNELNVTSSSLPFQANESSIIADSIITATTPIKVGPVALYVPGEARTSLREGVVKGVVSPNAPAPFQLVHPTTDKRICFLYPGIPNLQLETYKNQKVLVFGDEYRDPRWPSDIVVFVRKIQLAP